MANILLEMKMNADIYNRKNTLMKIIFAFWNLSASSGENKTLPVSSRS